MASSSRNKAGYVKHGPSYVKIYKNDKVDGFTGHHQKDPHPAFMEIDDTSKEERPPYVIVVHGSRKVGKTLLIKCLEEYYSKRNVVGSSRCFCLGDNRRIQFVECPNNVNGMIDAAKYADAVMFLIDVGYGFEMETFEFLELLKVHGMPKVMGVLTYLDSFKDDEVRAYHQQNIMDRFQTEIYNGAKTFCLSGLDNAMYFEHEISELASVISTMEFHPLSWRAARPYMLVHIAGVGDFPLASVTILADPFPILPVNLKTNIEEVSNHDELTCMEIECFRAGTYVRFEIHDVPFEMVKNHDPCQPILVGGVSLEEAKVGYMQVRLERHSWHKKLLKTKDPIIVSVGWRRYQTIPMYTLEDCRGRNQVLNYTPKNKPCLATFWGPLAPPSTGLVVVQSLADYKAAFRILAKASVLEFNHDMDIVKKRKRIGTPYKIFKKTALIKDLFRSDLEIANFKDATIQTASGISGKVNKPAETDLVHGLDGIAKCTFKRKIHLRDTVFMYVYEQVEVPRFFNPVVRGPEPPDRIWQGVVDSCDLYVPANLDSYYKRYINPFDTRDRKLHLRWMCLMLAQDRATSEAEKLSIKRQIKELEIERDERRRDKESESLAPRRQALEQVRAVRFIEMEKIEKQLASSHEDEDSFKQLSEALLEKFEEYLKGKKGMTTSTVCPSSYSAEGFQVRHGTTCISIINLSGSYFGADGRSTTSNPSEPDDVNIVGEDEDKIYLLGERILVLIAGNKIWADWILLLLRGVVIYNNLCLILFNALIIFWILNSIFILCAKFFLLF
ncbi:hypothetical protein MKX03_032719 [Papaver bracteatum]|nr:hypothetical protein MKX03_032719 [Papaver bracteatum]